MNLTMSEAQKAKFKAALADLDVSRMPWGPTFTPGVCSKTGKPKISCNLHAADNRTHGGIPVESGVKAGGIGWPAQTFVFETDDPSAHEIRMGARASLHMAVFHETDESVFFEGKPLVDPHAEAQAA